MLVTVLIVAIFYCISLAFEVTGVFFRTLVYFYVNVWGTNKTLIFLPLEGVANFTKYLFINLSLIPQRVTKKKDLKRLTDKPRRV